MHCSRNTYLNQEERQAVLILSRTIFLGEKLVKEGMRNAAELKEAMETSIHAEPLAKIDYVEVVSMDTIEKLEVIKGSVLVAIAVYIGKTRLIDNFIMEVQDADTGTKE